MSKISSPPNHEMETAAAGQPPAAGRGLSRRALVAAGGLALAGAAARAQSQGAPIRVGFISNLTGPLAAFGVTDSYVHRLLAPQLAAGLNTVHLGKRPVQLELRDSASSSEQAAAQARALIADGVHMLVATGTPIVCNPVADVCEEAGVPCVTTIAPWQSWLNGRKQTTPSGFRWTYHFFAGIEDFAQVYSSLFKSAGLGPVVGGLWGDDADASAFLSAFPQTMAKRSLTLFDPGRVKLAAPDFVSVARRLKDANVPMVTGVLPPPSAVEFFAAARKVGYKPRMASIAKAFAFPETVMQVAQVAPPGMALTNEVWWSPAWPFKSGLTGMSAQQLCDDFEATTKGQWLQTLGFSHALIDVVAETVRQAKTPTREGLRDSISHMRANTVAGAIEFKSRIPLLNVCTTPAVGGQWERQTDGRWTLQVVDNTRVVYIPVTSKLRV